MLKLALLLIGVLCHSCCGQEQDALTLKLVSVVYRHGDRAPDAVEMFPKDPYYNYTFFPFGLGGLTNDGKLREYRLGKAIRERYDAFLGDYYLPNSVKARSTDYARTKMCLQLVLASVYPPNGKQQWNKDLEWQPIPMTYVPSDKDTLMIPEQCARYMRERDLVESSPKVASQIESFQEFMNELSNYTGKEISVINDMYNLYHILTAEAAMNLTLPDWTHGIFPKGKLLDGILLWYETFSYNSKLRRLNGGMLLHDILKEFEAVRENRANAHKLLLYSGHETNIAALLQTLGIFDPHAPAYSSAVIIEFHQSNSDYFVKILYNLGIPAKWVAKTIPGCEELCPLNTFLELLDDVIPKAEDLHCQFDFEIVDNKISRCRGLACHAE